MFALVTLGSLTELFLHNRDTKVNENEKGKISKPNLFLKYFVAFSVISNTRKLFHISRDSNNTLGSLHGIRIITMLWIVIGHTYGNGG